MNERQSVHVFFFSDSDRGLLIKLTFFYQHQYTTLLIMELHICACGELKPDPERDPVRAVFYTVVNDVPIDSSLPRQYTGSYSLYLRFIPSYFVLKFQVYMLYR